MRAARFAPGTTAWLLEKQLAWQWRGVTAGQRTWMGILLVLALLAVGVLAFTLHDLSRRLHLNGPLPTPLFIPLGAGLLFIFTLMLAAAINSSVEMLFTRGDLDLLLQSPLPPRAVLASRALSVAVSALLAAALMLVPLLLLMPVLGLWRGLGLLLWWADSALLSASLGLWLTLGLVRLIGVRRTRTVASVIGALVGAGVFLAGQWHNIAGQDAPQLVRYLPELLPGAGFWPGAGHALWFPVRTAWFDLWPALTYTVFSLLLFALTVLALTRQFTAGVQEVSEKGLAVSRRAGKSGPLRFASGRRATLLKEWRLILRDPELLSRTLLQLVYLVPLLAPALRGGQLRGAVGAGVVLLCSSLSSALANITLNAEDAPDLLRSAPRSPAALRAEKWLAAVLPTTFLGLLALALLLWRGALGGAGAAPLLPLLLLGTGGSAMMLLWQPLPVRRADLFKSNRQRGAGQVILGLIFQLGLTGAAFALGSLWALLPLGAALVALLVAFNLRRSDVEES